MVASNGGRTFGAGFTSSRGGTGVYNITFPSATWPTTPMLVATPFSTNGGFTSVITAFTFSGGAATYQVTVFSSAGTPADSAFTFVAAAT
jgi:hypothetical protein